MFTKLYIFALILIIFRYNFKKEEIKLKSLNDIIQKLKELKPILERDYKVSELGIFGSYIRGEQKDTSDIDILIDFKDDAIGLFKFMDLEELLQSVLGEKIDLVCKDSLKPRIGKQILSEVVYL